MHPNTCIYKEVENIVKHSPLRRTPPSWDIPSELWRIMFWPEWACKAMRFGLGYGNFKKQQHVVPAWIKRVCIYVVGENMY